LSIPNGRQADEKKAAAEKKAVGQKKAAGKTKAANKKKAANEKESVARRKHPIWKISIDEKKVAEMKPRRRKQLAKRN